MTKRWRRGDAGFTMLEVLVVLTVLGLMAAWGLPSMVQLLNRIRLTSTADEALVMMQRARLEAIKKGTTAQVVYKDAATSTLGQPSFEVTVTGIATPVLGPSPLPKGIRLWGPTDTSAEGAHSMVTWTTGPTFNSDGSVEQTGAYRLRDQNGNYLEVNILFEGTGKGVIRKWFGGANPDANWHERGEPGYEWQF